MGSLTDPKTWIPHININPKDCSQKICTLYCKKWCKYVILPSPSPPPPPSTSGATLSPVLIVIITIIASFFLVIGYYFMISRICYRENQSSLVLTREVSYNLDQTHDPELGVLEGHDELEDHSNYVPWVVVGKGLDEALVKSISICKYKKEGGLVTCTDCSVCLGEFQEDESIKVLPKCSHAFHVYCIDTWLKTHLNCPLCRANVCCDVQSSRSVSPSLLLPSPSLSVLTNELGERDVGLEIREEGQMKMKRSKSMDYLGQTRSSVAQVMFSNRTQTMPQLEVGTRGDIRSSENALEGSSMGGFNFLYVNHFGVKRSYSSGGYVFTTNGV